VSARNRKSKVNTYSSAIIRAIIAFKDKKCYNKSNKGETKEMKSREKNKQVVQKDTMYKGMELDKEYTLEELGL